LACSNRGDVVLDPFLGSGTTAAVARRLGRYVIGFEINEGYLSDVVVPRLRAPHQQLALV
jgi:DNA modification methylase